MDSRDLLILADYYFHDSRLILIPIEGLTPAGLCPTFADLLVQRAGWDAARIDLFSTAFRNYWARSAALAARTPAWAPPRLRHAAIVRDAGGIRPYVQMLNVSAWTLYESDFDPETSTAEFATYLFVHGDRMVQTGEVTRAALLDAPYWFDRDDIECAAFVAGAQASTRPDTDGFRAVAEALPWLRELSHETLRRPALVSAYRSIPGSELLVRRDVEGGPPALVRRWEHAATLAVSRFHAHQPPADPRVVSRVCNWLATDRPRLLVGGRHQRILWDPETPDRIGALRSELRLARGPALADIAADLEAIWQRTSAFHGALRDPTALPAPPEDIEHGGYVYLHRQRGLITYNLHEPGLDRLQSPAIPYARAMLGARAIHEWAHLAVDAGWVPLRVERADFLTAVAGLAANLDATIEAAPVAILRQTEADLRDLVAAPVEPDAQGLVELARQLAPSAGVALACIILRRLADFQANLLAQRFLTPAERETYVRQNVRELRSQYPPQRRWRMLARYLYEYQYLRFSAVEEPDQLFLRSTWFDADFIDAGILDRDKFISLASAVGRLCDAFAVDEERFV